MAAIRCCVPFTSSGKQGGHWSNQCCIHTDGVWNPHTGSPLDKDHVAGQWVGATPPKNVWKATLPAEFSVIDNPHLRVGGVRSPRARFPNANPETDIWPTGWVPDAQTWLPAKPPKSQPQYIGVLNTQIQSRNDGLDLNDSKPYSGGIGGPCEVFDPPFSYWCSEHPAGGGGFQYCERYRRPAGVFPLPRPLLSLCPIPFPPLFHPIRPPPRRCWSISPVAPPPTPTHPN